MTSNARIHHRLPNAMGLAISLWLGSANVHAITFIVDTTSDVSLTACTGAPADCSLRGAITSALGAAGADIVNFSIPTSDVGCSPTSGVCTITPASPFPFIFGGTGGAFAITIDGTTQPGWMPTTNTPDQGGLNAQLKIELSGASCGACIGLYLANASSVVRGLVINRFSASDVRIGANGVVVEGNFLGTDVTGNSVPTPASQNGISMDGNPNGGEGSVGGVRIGGVLPAERNLISGHPADGVRMTGFGIQLLGNLIGTNAAGTAALPNRHGVAPIGGGPASFPYQYLIGNGLPSGRNLISGNAQGGVQFELGQAISRDSRIQGNYIGTDITGQLPLGNGVAGINTIVTTVPDDPLVALTIGGLLPAQANRIRFNGGPGISVGRPRAAVLGNQMGRNGQLGISMLAVNRRVNDSGDGDSGPNSLTLQNFPEVSSFALAGANINLSYQVNSTAANSAYPLRVEFFKADGDEGSEFIGADSYEMTDAQIVKAISLPIPGGVVLASTDVIVGTATDAAGNTSEFSFHPVVLNIIDDGPDPSPSGTSYAVTVEVAALSGPFVPHGVLQISDGTGGVCTATLAPAAAALTASGTCLLATGGAPRSITLTASYNTFQHAFATEAGTSPSATTAHTLGPPPPEQVTFARCVEYVLEAQGTASIRVNRQGGSNVSVAFEHVAGTATAGLDYTAPAAGVLNWVGSDQTPRFINVPILSDAVPEPVAETFRLRLFDPLGTSITPTGLLEARIHDAPPGRVFHDGFDGNGCP